MLSKKTIKEFENEYNVQVVGISWCPWEENIKVQLYSELGFGNIKLEKQKIERIDNGLIKISTIIDGIEYIYCKQEV